MGTPTGLRQVLAVLRLRAAMPPRRAAGRARQARRGGCRQQARRYARLKASQRRQVARQERLHLQVGLGLAHNAYVDWHRFQKCWAAAVPCSFGVML